MSEKKQIGKVTPEERNEIQTLFERRNGLNELANILKIDNEELYEKLVKDLGDTGIKFQNWWDRMAEKYQWESAENSSWEINFDTCEIYLVVKKMNLAKHAMPVLERGYAIFAQERGSVAFVMV